MCILLYCFYRIYACRKKYIILISFLRMNIKRILKKYKSNLKTTMTKKQVLSLDFKKDEPKNYLLEEIKHNDLMSEKYKKTCKY